MNSINIYFIRHGCSFANEKADRIGQSTDEKLSDLGIKQANLLGDRFLKEGIVFDYAASSPYERAHHTANIVLDKIKFPIDLLEVDIRLREYDPGSFKGKSRTEIFSDPKIMLPMRHLNMHYRFPNGDSLIGFSRNIAEFIDNEVIYRRHLLRTIEKEKRDINFAIFSHGIAIKCALFYILGFDPSMTTKIHCDNTSITSVSFNHEYGWFVNEINDTAHLKDI